MRLSEQEIVDGITPGRFAGQDALWTVWEAAEPLLPTQVSTAAALGLTGAPTRSVRVSDIGGRGLHPTPHDALTRTDLSLWITPGLVELGVRATLTPLPAAEREGLRLLRERTRRGVGVPLFGYTFPEEEPEADGEGARLSPRERAWQEAAVAAQAVALEADLHGVRLQQTEGGKIETLPWSAVRVNYAEALLLKRAHGGARSGERMRAGLGRWAAFAAAYPERMPCDEPGTADACALLAAFLEETAGKRRDRIANRLRKAAAFFRASPPKVEERRSREEGRTPSLEKAGRQAWETPNLTAAFELLIEAVCGLLDLPASTIAALCTPPDLPLTDLERRELIYLARAGVRDLRALAAWRLQPEHRCSDAARTLEQMHDDPDLWVRRTAARRS